VDDRLGRGGVGQGRNIEDDSMDLDYCQGISTIVLSFERETRKWSGWKELAGIYKFDETDYVPSVPGFPGFPCPVSSAKASESGGRGMTSRCT
jgi:hypothetical protein